MRLTDAPAAGLAPAGFSLVGPDFGPAASLELAADARASDMAVWRFGARA